MTDSEELVVLLADDGTPIGSGPNATVHHENTPLHLAFSCYVFDKSGRLVITQRALDKPTFPGMWTNSGSLRAPTPEPHSPQSSPHRCPGG